MRALDTVAEFEVPERVAFAHRLAGLGPRSLAWAFDLGLQFVAASVVGFALLLGAPQLPTAVSGMTMGLGLIAGFFLQWFYAALFEGFTPGQTPGKWIFGLRVVQADGSPIRWQHALLRNILRAVDFVPGTYWVGALVAAQDPQFRRIGDLVAGTVVVLTDGIEAVGDVPIRPAVTAEERAAMPSGVRLRREEQVAIEMLLSRQDRLSASWVEGLAARLGPRIAEREGIDAPTWLRTLTLAYARVTGRDRP